MGSHDLLAIAVQRQRLKRQIALGGAIRSGFSADANWDAKPLNVQNLRTLPWNAWFRKSNLARKPALNVNSGARVPGKRRRIAVAVVETQKQGDIAVIRMDNPPVNALGHALRVGLEKAFAEANADAGVKAIVLTGTGRFAFGTWQAARNVSGSAGPAVSVWHSLFPRRGRCWPPDFGTKRSACTT